MLNYLRQVYQALVAALTDAGNHILSYVKMTARVLLILALGALVGGTLVFLYNEEIAEDFSTLASSEAVWDTMTLAALGACALLIISALIQGTVTKGMANMMAGLVLGVSFVTPFIFVPAEMVVQEIVDAAFWIVVSTTVLVIVGLLVFTFRKQLFEQFKLDANRQLTDIGDNLAQVAGAVVAGDKDKIIEHGRSSVKTLLSVYANAQLRIWTISTLTGLIAALAAYATVIAVMKQNEILIESNRQAAESLKQETHREKTALESSFKVKEDSCVRDVLGRADRRTASALEEFRSGPSGTENSSEFGCEVLPENFTSEDSCLASSAGNFRSSNEVLERFLQVWPKVSDDATAHLTNGVLPLSLTLSDPTFGKLDMASFSTFFSPKSNQIETSTSLRFKATRLYAHSLKISGSGVSVAVEGSHLPYLTVQLDDDTESLTFDDSFLENAKFSANGKVMKGSFNNAHIRCGDFTGMNFGEAVFTFATLIDTDFSGASFESINLTNAAIAPSTNFTGVTIKDGSDLDCELLDQFPGLRDAVSAQDSKPPDCLSNPEAAQPTTAIPSALRE